MNIWKIVARIEYGKSDELDKKFDVIEDMEIDFERVSELFNMLDRIAIFYEMDDVYSFIIQDALDNRDLINTMWRYLPTFTQHKMLIDAFGFGYCENGDFYYKII